MRNIIIVIAAALLGCSGDMDHNHANHLSGYYRVVSIRSSVAVDMNNSGIKSQDLFLAISGPHTTVDGGQASFYDFDEPQNYMEIRPLENTTNNAQLIAINFPDQYLDQLQDGTVYLSSYEHSFINYSYKTHSGSDKIELINNNPDLEENGSIDNFDLQSGGELKLELTKKLFDFYEQEWIDAKVTAIYQEVE